MSKVCGKCLKSLEIERFTGAGKYTYCKPCSAEKTRAWYARNKQAAKGRLYNRRRELIASGRCVCNKGPLVTGRTKCQLCLDVLRSKQYLAKRKLKRVALRDAVFAAYGGYVCRCCGVTGRLFVALDHTKNDGASHRKSISKRTGSDTMYAWVKRNQYPSTFQVLCHNCNIAKHMNGGTCPHKEMVLG